MPLWTSSLVYLSGSQIISMSQIYYNVYTVSIFRIVFIARHTTEWQNHRRQSYRSQRQKTKQSIRGTVDRVSSGQENRGDRSLSACQPIV
jgi:hypothetical protein